MLAENQVTDLVCSHPNSILKPDGDPGINILVVLGRADETFAVFLESTRAEHDHVRDTQTRVERNRNEIGKIFPTICSGLRTSLGRTPQSTSETYAPVPYR